jgi:hypothetical protein
LNVPEIKLAAEAQARPDEKFPKLDTLRLTRGKNQPYNETAGWRGILLSPASFSFETLAPHQPASSYPSRKNPQP